MAESVPALPGLVILLNFACCGFVDLVPALPGLAVLVDLVVHGLFDLGPLDGGSGLFVGSGVCCPLGPGPSAPPFGLLLVIQAVENDIIVSRLLLVEALVLIARFVVT
jgi:hypothetical protein